MAWPRDTPLYGGPSDLPLLGLMGRTQDRPFDLVLLGATGYTGGLVAHHLAASGEPLRWAIAGRAPQKLAALAADLAQATPQATPPQTLVEGVSDPEQGASGSSARHSAACASIFEVEP